MAKLVMLRPSYHWMLIFTNNIDDANNLKNSTNFENHINSRECAS
jgi:hypothetical protein